MSWVEINQHNNVLVLFQRNFDIEFRWLEIIMNSEIMFIIVDSFFCGVLVYERFSCSWVC